MTGPSDHGSPKIVDVAEISSLHYLGTFAKREPPHACKQKVFQTERVLFSLPQVLDAWIALSFAFIFKGQY